VRYPWLVVPWLVPNRWTSWVWPGGVVVSRLPKADVSDRHRLHEEQHVLQQRCWLVLAPVVWLVLLVWTVAHGRDWYYDHPWEVEARWAGCVGEGLWRPRRRVQRVVGWLFTGLALIWALHALGLDVVNLPW
jgi:hypothetical protein